MEQNLNKNNPKHLPKMLEQNNFKLDQNNNKRPQKVVLPFFFLYEVIIENGIKGEKETQNMIFIAEKFILYYFQLLMAVYMHCNLLIHNIK